MKWNRDRGTRAGPAWPRASDGLAAMQTIYTALESAKDLRRTRVDPRHTKGCVTYKAELEHVFFEPFAFRHDSANLALAIWLRRLLSKFPSCWNDGSHGSTALAVSQRCQVSAVQLLLEKAAVACPRVQTRCL